MSQVQTNELPHHLAPLLTVEEVAARLNLSRSSIAARKPTREVSTIRTRSTLHPISDISHIDVANWVMTHTAEERHLHSSLCRGSHDA
jgi:hypothetical protein